MFHPREVTAIPRPRELPIEAYYAGLAEVDRAAVQAFVALIETVNKPVLRHYAVGGDMMVGHQFVLMAVGSSVVAQGQEPYDPDSTSHPIHDIDLRILHPGREARERGGAIDIIRERIRRHLVGRFSFIESEQTYKIGGNVFWDSGEGRYNGGPAGIRSTSAYPDIDPSFQIFPNTGRPLHILISGIHGVPTSEHLAAERSLPGRPFSVLIPPAVQEIPA